MTLENAGGPSSGHEGSYTNAKSNQRQAKEISGNTTTTTKQSKHEPIPQLVSSNDTPKDTSQDERTEPEIGTSCTVMKLWEGRSFNGRLIWLTEAPKVEAETESTAESAQYAITLLHKKIDDTGKQALETIIIRTPELRRYLEDVIPNMASFYREEEHGVALRSPFRLLFWYRDSIATAADSKDKPLKEAATLLQGVLDEQFRDLLAKRKELVAEREMNFNALWTIFKPGITCITTHKNDDIFAVKVSAIDFSKDPMGQLYYRIKYTALSWDGEFLGWQDSYTDIMEFTGRRKIKDLAIFPIEFHGEGAESVTERLVSRGKDFVQLAIQEPCLMSFNGEALDREASPMWWQGEQKKRMSERIVLDARAYNHYNRRIYVTKWMKRAELNDILASDDQSIFLFCCPELYCFALQRKKWARVWISDVAEVTFNEAAYPSLVLPNDYKELLLAFAEAQIDGYGFDDVIAGKGQGILMLLAGSPGTGKTLTAEAMAEQMKRPLYGVAAGELGASAGSGGMENELDRILELCTRWNAVLLLDEADVFLERRTDNDIQRNSIVSIFLRKLEYYRGIMILTTNRFHAFDEAFKSRIHIAIRYPDLDVSARRTIWETFLKRANDIYEHGVHVSGEEVDELSQRKLNGREIRNIVKSAQLLASRTKQTLRRSHLDIVWRVEHEDSVWRELDGD